MKSACGTNSLTLVITVAKGLLGSKSRTGNLFKDENISSCISLKGRGRRSEKFRNVLLQGDNFQQSWSIHAAVTSNPISTVLPFLQSHPKHWLLSEVQYWIRCIINMIQDGNFYFPQLCLCNYSN